LKADSETFGPLLHGTARAWRLKLDERLRPMGLSQAKWRTLLHLSVAPRQLTQSEIAARLGIEEPTLVTLLHRLERDGWVRRRHSPNDRRCKIVDLGWRAQRVIARINRTANELRHELLASISEPELRICMRVLTQIRQRAEKESGFSRGKGGISQRQAGQNGQTRNGRAINGVKKARHVAHKSK
jgi:MarR family transcriptional regulator, transcriptional regulator for hemolysin